MQIRIGVLGSAGGTAEPAVLKLCRRLGQAVAKRGCWSLLKRYEQELLSGDWHTIREGIEVKLLPVPAGIDDEEVPVTATTSRQRCTRQSCNSATPGTVHSLAAAGIASRKGAAILRRFEQRIEQRLQSMTRRCEKQYRDPQKVEREVGRLLGQNTRGARLFDVQVKRREDGSARVEWKKLEDFRDWAQISAGCYLLRTNVLDWTDEELWKTYMQLTEAEKDHGRRPDGKCVSNATNFTASGTI